MEVYLQILVELWIETRQSSIVDSLMAVVAPAMQELNPVPFAVTFASTACWCAYGFAAPGT